jgi:CubicO group peptidase (beta-lactamase class C family)
MKRWLIIILFSATCNYTSAQTAKDTTAIINSFFWRYTPENPGGELAISKDGKVIFSKAWGLADLDHQVAYTTETVSEVGSISKQFTAAAILLLAQQGKLSLDDDVRKYFPQLPDYGSVIKIKNLLHHTSGLREWSDLVAVTGWPRTTRAYGNQYVLNLLCHQKKLNNIPGEEFIYSNSNYILLTLIVEKVSGMMLPDFTRKYIFEPAGMTHTSWRDDYRKVVLNRAIAYAKKGGVYQINMPNESVYGPGGLLTTAEDLLKWDNFYLNNKLGNPGLLDEQTAIDLLTNGAETNYAAGLFIDKVNGLKEISHTGQTASYVGIVENFPSIKLSIAWLSNTTGFKSGLFDEIAQIENLFVKDSTTHSLEHEQQPIALSQNAKKYVGWYRYTKDSQGIKIIFKNDTLWFNNTALSPINNSTFRYKASVLKFTASGDFILNTADKRHLLFTHESENNGTVKDLQAYTGKYYSEETESDFTIMFKNGKLFLEKDNIKNVELLPTYNQAFNCFLNLDSELNPVPEYMVFEQDARHKVSKCIISTNDARGIEFEKIK